MLHITWQQVALFSLFKIFFKRKELLNIQKHQKTYIYEPALVIVEVAFKDADVY